MPAPIVSPVPAIVKEILVTTSATQYGLITAVVRGRVLEVSVVDPVIVLVEGDAILVELLPASKQWVVVPFIR